jgi:hypothetical protein
VRKALGTQLNASVPAGYENQDPIFIAQFEQLRQSFASTVFTVVVIVVFPNSGRGGRFVATARSAPFREHGSMFRYAVGVLIRTITLVRFASHIVNRH